MINPDYDKPYLKVIRAVHNDTCDICLTAESAEYLILMWKKFDNITPTFGPFCSNNYYDISFAHNSTYLKELTAFIKNADFSFKHVFFPSTPFFLHFAHSNFAPFFPVLSLRTTVRMLNPLTMSQKRKNKLYRMCFYSTPCGACCHVKLRVNHTVASKDFNFQLLQR